MSEAAIDEAAGAAAGAAATGAAGREAGGGATAARGPAGGMRRTAVAALTYNRPQGLDRLLDGIAALIPGAAAPAAVVIVDNSEGGNAQGQVLTRAKNFPFPLHYAHEAARGIAAARNRALAEATALGADWLAFIDDDEFPEPGWLAAMAAVADREDAAVVVGALLPEFQNPPPAWLANGRFLEIAALADGDPVPIGNTSNVLFDLSFARRHGVGFDPAFALTGGEDTLFFDDLKRRGAKMVFCRSGVVRETIAPQRQTLRWNLARWTRSGNTDGRIAMRQAPGRKSRAGVFGGGLARIAVGGGRALALSPLALAGRGHHAAEQLRIACRGVGFVRAALGSVIEEYRNHDR